jgi:hypothetical protein
MSDTPAEQSLREQVTQLLSDDYACTRVWEAWQYGTMTQDDFMPLTETERVDEIIALIESHTSKVCQQKEREARIDELQRVDTRRHYGKDYQDSLDELDEYKDARIAQLEAAINKEKE